MAAAQVTQLTGIIWMGGVTVADSVPAVPAKRITPLPLPPYREQGISGLHGVKVILISAGVPQAHEDVPPG